MNRRSFVRSAAATALLPMAGPQNKTTLSNPRVAEIRGRIKPITPEERNGRIENARKLMSANGVDVLFCESGVTLNYFSGVSWGRSERVFAMLLPREGEPVFVAPKFEESRAVEQVGGRQLFTWEEDQSPYRLIRSILTERGHALGVMAMEESTRSFIVEGIRHESPSIQLVSGTPVTAECRCVKTSHELELMQIANDMTREVYQDILPLLRDGMKERELGSLISKGFNEFGANGGALVLFGEASAHPHGLVKEHVLREGEVVLIDGGCSVEGFASDVTRTTVFGMPSKKMKEVWSIIRQAQDAGLAAARPGVAAEDIDAAAREVIVKAGYGPDYKYFTHRLGHGIGMEGHEWYYLVRGNKRKERVGETHSNEPGIYIPGEFGIRLEDEMVITETGARLMLPQAESLEKIF